MRKFKLEIITPEKIFFQAKVESIIAPAEDGYLGVMAYHAPLLCTIKAGEIIIKEGDGARSIAISGGFIEVSNNKAIILADSVEDVGGINLDRAQKSRDRALERFASKDKKIDCDRAQASLDRALNRIRLHEKHKK